jgi:hypothetical protein
VFRAVVNATLLYRDLGLGDSSYFPLPNGYSLLMIDVSDQRTVYNPKTEPGDIVGDQEDATASNQAVREGVCFPRERTYTGNTGESPQKCCRFVLFE